MALHRLTLSRCLFALSALFLLASTVTGPTADAQDGTPLQTVDVTGSSPVSLEDPAGMREKALADGLARAVFQVASETIDPEVFSRKTEAIRSVLLENPQNYIETYRVLGETETEEDYQVFVQVAVSVELIAAQLKRVGILGSEQRLPKILFLASQQNLTDPLPRYWWSGNAGNDDFVAIEAMGRAMRENGFDVFSPRAPGVMETAVSKGFAPYPEDRQAIDLALQLGAEVAVVGHASAESAGGAAGSVMRTYQAVASLRALEVPSGTVLAAVTQEATATDAEDRIGGLKALAAAGSAAGESLEANLKSAWLTRQKEAAVLRIEVEGTRALAEFVRFRRILNATAGVRGSQIEVLASDRAVIAVDFNGNVQSLAANLMANSYPSFGIDISDMSDRGFTLRLVK